MIRHLLIYLVLATAACAGVYEDVMAAYGYTVPAQVSVYDLDGLKLVGVHNSGHTSERQSSLTLHAPKCVLQVLVADARPGDVLLILGEGQLTSERPTNTETISRLWWATGSGAISGTEISEENGENVDLNEHHHKMHASGSFVVPEGTPVGALRYVSWVWHALNGATMPQFVMVNQDYGRLIVLQFRKL